jgi:3-phenylpropionate/cinnamic acid dioxygenase small subunit
MGLKVGVADPDGREKQGLLARRFFLDGGVSAGVAANDPQLAALYKDKFALEDRIDALRTKKSAMTADAYDDALEELLVDLARKAKAIREMEGRTS